MDAPDNDVAPGQGTGRPGVPAVVATPPFLEPVPAPAAVAGSAEDAEGLPVAAVPDAAAPDDGPPTTTAVPLLAPREGVPPVVADDAALTVAIEALVAGTGPVAVDAERASGYRYGQRAYLVQLRRQGAGTVLVDPVGVPDLTRLGDALTGTEWVLHAASQDLPCLDEVGMRPTSLFDTELAGRLAGLDRVGLGPMVENVLGFQLEKGHSAADWSTRPLPEPWLRYAALDVELLVELRDALEAELERQGKLAWALEEFAAIVTAPPKEPPAEPWRRTSGLHRVRTRRQLAAVRSVWQARDEMARRRDVAPGRVLPDRAIVDAVLAGPPSAAALEKLPVFSGPRMRRTSGTWFAALEAARGLSDTELPGPSPSGGMPPASRWKDREPDAAARLTAGRAAVAEIAEQHALPAENLLEPALLRRLAWDPPAPLDEPALRAALEEGRARPWQIGLVLEPLLPALAVSAGD